MRAKQKRWRKRSAKRNRAERRRAKAEPWREAEARAAPRDPATGLPSYYVLPNAARNTPERAMEDRRNRAAVNRARAERGLPPLLEDT